MLREGNLTLQEMGESGVRVCGQIWEEELAADWLIMGSLQLPWVCGQMDGRTDMEVGAYGLLAGLWNFFLF